MSLIRDTFVALWCSPIHGEPTGFIALLKCNKKNKKTSKHNIPIFYIFCRFKNNKIYDEIFV